MTNSLRARDLGVPFEGSPGAFNAITDVPGVAVGHSTLIEGGEGDHAIRTGITVIHPLGADGRGAVAAGRAVINGTGEWTGMHLVDEIGEFFGPVALTGTGNLGVVHRALVEWSSRQSDLLEDELYMRSLPVVGETLDSMLNDVFGGALGREHVFAALDRASSGPVTEGNVGGGTGMVAYQFKGGIGTSSRVVAMDDRRYTVGVLVQTNHARRRELRIAGIPIGAAIADLMPSVGSIQAEGSISERRKSSLLVVIATDAPLQSHQLSRMARRASLGVGRSGSTAGGFSGEFALAFSTANSQHLNEGMLSANFIHDHDSKSLNALFRGTVEAVEEALVNQLVASETMTGKRGLQVYSLPHDRLVDLLRRHSMLLTT
jgi:L-aminopeptidase/D-esterase-like protein